MKRKDFLTIGALALGACFISPAHVWAQFDHVREDKPQAAPKTPLFTNGATLQGVAVPGQRSASPRQVQNAIVASLRAGEFSRAKALMKTPGGQAILKAAPDYEERVSKYIEAAIQKEMTRNQKLDRDNFSRIMQGELKSIVNIGDNALKNTYLKRLEPQNVQRLIGSSLNRLLEQQMNDLAASMMDDKRKAEIDGLLKERFEAMGKEKLESLVKQRLENMSPEQKQELAKKQVQRILRKKVELAVQDELKELQRSEFMDVLKQELHKSVKPVAKGIKDRNQKVITTLMLSSDGKLTELFEALDTDQIAKIFSSFERDDLVGFSNALGKPPSDSSNISDISRMVALSDPAKLETLVKDMNADNHQVFIRAMMDSDLTALVRNTYAERMKATLMESLEQQTKQKQP